MLTITDEKQKVLDATGNLLVMGGPGSGKTTIALLKADHVTKAGVLNRGQKILFLSFARATIARVEQHAKSVLSGNDSDAIEINTYHGFTWNILRSHGRLLIPHMIRLLPPHDASARLSTFAESDEKDAEKARLFADEGLLHFDLFAKNCLQLLAGSKVLSEIVSDAYPIIILDEFQDTDLDQWMLVKHLGQRSTLIALADPEQRIYDFRGADPARLGQFIEAFHPQEFNFGTENNRSNGTDIVQFGNDLLSGRNIGKEYADVTIARYPRRKGKQEVIQIKAYILGRLKKIENNPNWSLAVLVPSNRLMMDVSDMLGKQNHFTNGKTMPPISHEVSVDVTGPALAATVIARILELSSQQACRMEDIGMALCGYILGRRGGEKNVPKGDQDLSKALSDYLSADDYSKPIRGKIRQQIITDCSQIAESCNTFKFTGEVSADWVMIRNALKDAESDCLKKLYEDALFIRLLRKGSLLNNGLAQLWRVGGNYVGATESVKNAITQEHFATSKRVWGGINVMTIHKSKGKEFDEVIIYEGPFAGQRFVSYNDVEKARLVLRVAVTRAKQSALIVTPQNEPCPIL
ncbi:MAG: UvrD-helicase domain-containing protein [Candidatus Saccharimonadales bacterium]